MTCTNSHAPVEMVSCGFHALKEAGAGMTILAYKCGHCFRELYVTESCPRSDLPGIDLAGIDGTP